MQIKYIKTKNFSSFNLPKCLKISSSSKRKIITGMTLCILSIITLVLEISENRHLLIKLNQKKDGITTTKHARATHRQMNIFTEHIPIGIPYGAIPNVPMPLTLHNPHFPHNQYLPVVGR